MIVKRVSLFLGSIENNKFYIVGEPQMFICKGNRQKVIKTVLICRCEISYSDSQLVAIIDICHVEVIIRLMLACDHPLSNKPYTCSKLA